MESNHHSDEQQVDVGSLAHRMLHDYDAKTPGTAFAEGLRLSNSQARQLQNAVTALREARGEAVVGYKIGCVCAENQKNNGLSSPVWGRLWSTEQHGDAARFHRSAFANAAIEGEIAVTLRGDLKPGASPELIARSVTRIFPVIELHNLVLRGPAPTGAELIANNAIHAGVVRGGGSTELPFDRTDISVWFDGERVEHWTQIRWPEDILQAVGWLVESLAENGIALRRGQTILTGALGPPLPVANVNHVQVRSSCFGEVEAWFS